MAEVPPGGRVGGPQSLHGALEGDLPAGLPGAGTEIYHVVGHLDHLRLVLDDQHGVGLVAQAQQQVAQPLDVVGMQSGGRLVEHVGHVGERRPEVADHLGALRLAARQRPGRPVERQVAEPDLHERLQRAPQGLQQRRHRRLVEAAHPLRQVADLHHAGIGDADPPDHRRASRLGEPGAAAVGTGDVGGGPVHERPDVGLHRLPVLGEERLPHLGDQPLVGDVHVQHPDLGRLPVQEVRQLRLRVVPDRLVRVHEPRLGERLHRPAALLVPRDGDGPLGQRLGVVVELGQVDVRHRAPALAVRAHPAGPAVGLPDGLAGALPDRDRTGCPHRGHVERERIGRPDVRLPQPGEQDPQHGVDVGGGTHRGAGVGPHALLVHDDGRGEPLEHIDIGPRQSRHEPLHEGAVGLVDQPLRFGGDRVDDQGTLPRPRHPREHRQPPLGDLDAHIPEVVLPSPRNPDQIMATCDTHRVHATGSQRVVHRTVQQPTSRPGSAATASIWRPPPAGSPPSVPA